MTDGEMAEKYADWYWGASPSAKRAIKEAYLAGLKAGSQLDRVWHDYDVGEDCYEDSHEGRWVRREAGRP